MKVQLIYLNSTKEEFLPFGVAHISSILKKYGHCINLIDTTFGTEKNEILKRIEKFNPNIIGISATSIDFFNAIKIKNEIEKLFKILIVLGGIHATVAPEEAIKHFDTVCIGEGEYAFLELINKIQNKRNIFNTKNFWFRVNEKIIKNPVRKLIQNLDMLPFPDREAFDYERYLRVRNRQADFLSGRGCLFNCSYCVNERLHKIYHFKIVRKRSVDNLIEEIKEVQAKYKIKSIQFHDDFFTINKQWLKEFVEKYSKIGLPFVCNDRPDILDKEALKLLKEAGCKQLVMGIENGSEKIRRIFLNRKITNRQIIRVFKVAKKMNIKTKSNNIIGIPFETEKDILKTIRLNKNIQAEEIQVTLLTAYPGTKVYKICKENDWLTESLPISYYIDTNINHPTLSKEKIKSYYRKFSFFVYAERKPIKALMSLFKVNIYPFYTKIRDTLPETLKRVLWLFNER